ncbi:MAG: hypothetical protein R3C19_14140 [Planctomycetaceae bacterium]
MRWFQISAVATLMTACGCATISSTLIERDVCDTGYTDSTTKGVPITVKVPTHLKVVVRETRFLTLDGDTLTPVTFDRTVVVNNNGQSVLQTLSEPVVAVDVDHEYIETEKIFTVDFKRPAAGTLNYKLGFEDQYITSIQNELQDRTIADVSTAINRILGSVADLRTGGLRAGLSDVGERSSGLKSLQKVSSIRAAAVFEFDDPMFEVRLAEFLTQHLCAETCHDGAAFGEPIDGFTSNVVYPASNRVPSLGSGPTASRGVSAHPASMSALPARVTLPAGPGRARLPAGSQDVRGHHSY